MDDDEQQFIIWKTHAANHALQCAHALAQVMIYAPEGTEISRYINLAEFLLQEADSLCPDGSNFPEYENNVIPISTVMRRK